MQDWEVQIAKDLAALKFYREEGYNNIDLTFDADSLSINGESEDKIRKFLEHCYKVLASRYWNVSTKSQKEKLELVMYDKETGEFSLAPKRNPTPRGKDNINLKV